MRHNYWMLFLLGHCFALSLMAQAPPAFTYQAVATDATGDELTSQTIGLSLAILQGSSAGTAVYAETHSPTTDVFGLFTVSVGQGIPTGGSSFDEIDWSQGPYYLQVGLDVNGGTNFVDMGATMLQSVPFSLYSNHSNTANEALTAAFAETALRATWADTATWPNMHFGPTRLLLLSKPRRPLPPTWLLLPLRPRKPITELAQTAVTASMALNAFNAEQATFAQSAATAEDDDDRDPENELQLLQLQGDRIAISNGNSISLTAENTYYAAGADLSFPQGLPNTGYRFIPDQFTVPPGMNFYIVASEDEIRLPGLGSQFGIAKTTPHFPIVPGGMLVDNCRCLGFLVPTTTVVNPLVFVLQANGGSEYTVPEGRFLVIKSGIDENSGLTLNNIPLDVFSGPTPYLVIPGGITIRVNTDQEAIITGYLND
ncbi:MAG: hypothetical protein R2795_11975 [Saprospiraceae bacterium]